MAPQGIPNRQAGVSLARKNRVYTRREIEDQIARGRAILIIDQKVLKVDAWIPFHPGGHKAIQHMIGSDATEAVTALHSAEAKQRMNSYQIGRIEGAWESFIPPIQGGSFRTIDDEELQQRVIATEDSASSSSNSSNPSPIFDAPDAATLRRRKGNLSQNSSSTSLSSFGLDDTEIKPTPILDPSTARTNQILSDDLSRYPPLEPSVQNSIISKYRALDARIHAEGLYNCPYTAYAWETLRYALLFTLFLVTLQRGYYALSGVFLGALWHQLVFTVHDAGHMGITHNYRIDFCIGIFIADFIGGLSIGWWKRNHNVHHIVTNSPEHDPDIEHMPFFAISHRFFEGLRSTYYERVMSYDALAKFTIGFQHWLYYPLLCFGRFNLYRLSWEYLILGLGPRKGAAAWFRWLEIAGQFFFWYWFGYGVLYKSIPTWSSRIAFVLISHIVTMPLHVQITLSHFAMSTSDFGAAESFPQKMLRTTMDVDCAPWMDFFHGGLQFQVVHHLFPRVPRHNLRKVQPFVKEFCAETGIPYALYGFEEGNRKVIGRLGEVGRQAKLLEECRRALAEGKVDAH